MDAKDETVEYRWRGEISDAELVALTDSYGGQSAVGWWDRIRPVQPRMGHGPARERRGRGLRERRLGRMRPCLPDRHQGAGRPPSADNAIGTELVRIATDHAKQAGCEWLHVDYEEHLERFYLDACGFRPTRAGVIRLFDL